MDHVSLPAALSQGWLICDVGKRPHLVPVVRALFVILEPDGAALQHVYSLLQKNPKRLGLASC